MLNSYNKFYSSNTNNFKINAVSGGIYKNYKESWFQRLGLNSHLMEKLSDHENIKYSPRGNEFCKNNNFYKDAKPIVVLQIVFCGEMEAIAEIMYKEDFDKYFENNKEE